MDVNSTLQTIQDISNYKKPDELPYNVRDEVKQAMDDFRYVATSVYCVVLFNKGLLGVTKNGEHLADVLCVYVDLEKKTASFPKEKVNINDPKMYVAAVCYKNKKAVDVLLFPSSMFAKIEEQNKFAKFVNKVLRRKRLIEEDETRNDVFILNIRSPSELSLRKYGFGYVIGHLQGKE